MAKCLILYTVAVGIKTAEFKKGVAFVHIMYKELVLKS